MGVVDQSIIAQSLISVFLLVLLMSVLLVLAVLRWRRHKLSVVIMPPVEDRAPMLPYRARALPRFAPKRPHSWLAVRSSNVHAVQSALSLHNPKPCSWAEGLLGDGEHRLFVSPPVAGWILVIGPALPDPADDVDASFRFICDLSRKLGYIQFFHVNSVLDHHAWVRAENGRILRAYAWAGKTLWNQGHPTPAEMALAMKCYDYGETAQSTLFNKPDSEAGNSEKVHLLASRWSLDPAEIDGRFIGRERGIAGEVSRFF